MHKGVATRPEHANSRRPAASLVVDGLGDVFSPAIAAYRNASLAMHDVRANIGPLFANDQFRRVHASELRILIGIEVSPHDAQIASREVGCDVAAESTARRLPEAAYSSICQRLRRNAVWFTNRGKSHW